MGKEAPFRRVRGTSHTVLSWTVRLKPPAKPVLTGWTLPVQAGSHAVQGGGGNTPGRCPVAGNVLARKVRFPFGVVKRICRLLGCVVLWKIYLCLRKTCVAPLRWQTGMTSMRQMLTWAGRCIAHQMHSAISSG